MARKDCRLVNNSALTDADDRARGLAGPFNEAGAMNHEKHKAIERAVVGLVATAVSVNVLATELPRVLPYLIVLAVVVVVVRLVWWFTQP